MTEKARQARRINLFALIALWLVFYCSFTLFAPPLLDDADSVHAEVAREMLLRHDFVTLYANGIRYLEKAPVFYWLMALSMKSFGATTAASRVPLAFSVLALTVLLESFARHAFRSYRAGLYAGLTTLSSFGIFIFSRINIPDVLVCVFLTAALYAFYLTEDNPGAPSQAVPSLEVGSTNFRLLCWLFAAAIALNILTKGLIGIVFPVAIVGLYLLLTRGLRGSLRRLLQCHPISSTVLLLLIAVPWHILIALANPGHGHPGNLSHAGGHWQVPLPTDGNVHGWLWFYFLNEQIFRYLNLRVPHDYDTSPVWLFYGLIFIWLMPWSAFLPSAIARALATLRVPHLKRSHRLRWAAAAASLSRHSGAARISVLALRSFNTNLRALTHAARTNLFLLLWATVPLLFFTLSTRQEYYVLPSLPPLILLIAQLLGKPDAPAKPDESTIAEAAEAYLRDHLDEAIAEYRVRNTFGGTLSISSDAARELLPGYSTPEERTANTFVLSPASGRLADAVWVDARRTGPSQRRFIATFLTGSPGSGKTSSAIDSGEDTPVAVISEGMMDNFEISVGRIQAALDAGFLCSLRLVYADDPRTTLRRAVTRAMKFGRPVSIAHMGRLYVDIPQTVLRLAQHFGPRLGILVFDNSVDGRPPVLTTLAQTIHSTQAYTVVTATEAMRHELDKLRNNGTVSNELYRQFRKSSSPGSPANPHDSAASRGVGGSKSYADDGNQAGQDAPWRPGARAVSITLLVFGTVVAAVCLFFVLHASAPAPNADLASLLQQNPADYALSFGHFLDLTGPALALFRVPLTLAAIALFFGPLAHFVLRRRNQPHAATLSLAASAFLFLLAADRGLVIFSPTLTSYQLAEAIRPQFHPQDLLAIHGEYEAASTLGFYLHRNDIHIVEGRSSNLWYGSFFPDAPPIFETRDSIAQKWDGPQRIFLWQDPHDPARPPLALSPVYVIANSGGHQILSNQPSRTTHH